LYEFFLIVAFSIVSSIYACSWCKDVGLDSLSIKLDGIVEKPVGSFKDLLEQLGNYDSGTFKAFMDNNCEDSALSITQEQIKTHPELGEVFYKLYLAKYFPRALVITDHFTEMCPIAIEAALNEIIIIITNEPWFYFKNKPDKFFLDEYWEIILEQYKTISCFLERALIDPITNKVFLKDSGGLIFIGEDQLSNFEFTSNNNGIPLTRYWAQNGIDSFFKFHAQHCDFIIKIFNEAIQNQDYKKAFSYYLKLRDAVPKLQNSQYEILYQEKLEDDKWLLEELRKQQGYNV